MTRPANAHRVALRSCLALALCHCTASEPAEVVDPPTLASVYYSVDLSRPLFSVLLTPLRMSFAAPDGERPTPRQIRAYADAAGYFGNESVLPVRIEVDRAVQVGALLRVINYVLRGQEGFEVEFLVSEGARTGALSLRLYESLPMDVAPEERGCAGVTLLYDGADVVVEISDTTRRMKKRSPNFRNVEYSQLSQLAKEAKAQKHLPREWQGEVFALTDWDEDRYARILDTAVAASLQGSVPCGEATVFTTRNLRWEQLAPLLGGLQEIGLEEVCLYPLREATLQDLTSERRSSGLTVAH